MRVVPFGRHDVGVDAGLPGSRPVWQPMVAGFLISAIIVATVAAITRRTTFGGAGMDDNPLDAHLRASRRAQGDARRCSAELLSFAARHPGATAWALECDPALIAQARGQDGGLAALAMRKVEIRLAAVESAVQEVAHLRAIATPPGAAHIVAAGDLSGRAHSIAGRLCEAREAVSAATLMPPSPTRALVSGMNAAP